MKRDPGLQPERTFLAWSRTTIGLFVNAILVMRSGLLHYRCDVVVVGTAVMVLYAALIAFAWWRGSKILDGNQRPIALPSTLPFALAGGTLSTCVVAIWIVLMRLIGAVQ